MPKFGPGIAILSDAHANREAWNSAMASLSRAPEQNIVEYWFLGDALDGGPEPAYIVGQLIAKKFKPIMGNHDVVDPKLADFVSTAKDAQEFHKWSVSQLWPDQIQYLYELPQYHRDAPALAIHGLPTENLLSRRPTTKSTGVDTRAALTTIQGFDGKLRINPDYAEIAKLLERTGLPILFSGHTHTPRIIELTPEGEKTSGECKGLRADAIYREAMTDSGLYVGLNPGRVYIINAPPVVGKNEFFDKTGVMIYYPDASAIWIGAAKYDYNSTADKLVNLHVPCNKDFDVKSVRQEAAKYVRALTGQQR
ncbi:MAG: metallophosphoesterase [archaeon]